MRLRCGPEDIRALARSDRQGNTATPSALPLLLLPQAWSEEMMRMGEGTLALSDATFEEKVKTSDVPVVVDFWADRCGPSRMLSPVLAQVAAEHKGQLVVATVNVGDNPDTKARFEITSTPTLIVFRDGQPVKRTVGARPKSTLEQDLRSVIG
jgi:thioredoxin 1